MTKEKTIVIQQGNIVLNLVWDDETCRVEDENVPGCSLTSELKDVCPVCNKWDCYFSCDLSQAGPPEIPESTESEEDVANRKLYNAAIDGIESMVLGHAVAGVDIENDDYLEGLDAALQACGNNFS